jgi:hypothetical protein
MQKFAGLKIVLYQILIKISIGTEVILRPNGLRISRRERAASEGTKIARISRAQRSAACACWTAARATVVVAIPTIGFYRADTLLFSS